MAYGRKRIMMLCLSCALLFFCGCVFCWGALHAPAAFFSLASLRYVPLFVACGFSFGAVICALLHPKVSLCARLLFACVLYAAGFAAASRAHQSGLFFLCSYAVAGCGAGFAALCVLSSVSAWFPDRRGFCLGVCCGAAFFSSPILAPLTRVLFFEPGFGWRGTYLFIGLIGGTMFFVAAFALRYPISDAFSPASDFAGSVGPRRMVRTRYFFAVACCVCLQAAATIALRHCGVQSHYVSSSAAGFFAALGSCVFGALCDRTPGERLLALNSLGIGASAALFALGALLNIGLFAKTGLILCAFSGGALPALCCAVVSVRFRRRYFARNLACALTFTVPVCAAATLVYLLNDTLRAVIAAVLSAGCVAAYLYARALYQKTDAKQEEA